VTQIDHRVQTATKEIRRAHGRPLQNSQNLYQIDIRLYRRLPFAKKFCVLVDRKAAVLYPALLQVEPAGLDGIR
jgi:hypothetical protein